ncbi:hypothetical protein XM25_21870 [Devosia sp. H5989]|nr:hypothetical protein XM25_21870 [Devosia sp. H5989]
MLNLTLYDLIIRFGAYLLVAAIAGLLAQVVLRAMGGKAPPEGGGAGYGVFDGVGLIGALIFKQGWGRSPQPEPGSMWGGRLGLVVWVLVTLALTLLAVWGLRHLRPTIASFGTNVFTQGAISILNVSTDIGIWFALISLLPMPPLLGGNILLALFPGLRPAARGFYWPGTALAALFVGLGFAEATLAPAWATLRNWMLA